MEFDTGGPNSAAGKRPPVSFRPAGPGPNSNPSGCDIQHHSLRLKAHARLSPEPHNVTDSRPREGQTKMKARSKPTHKENNSQVNQSRHKSIHTQPNNQKGPTERLKARLRRTHNNFWGRSEWRRNLLTSVAHLKTFDLKHGSETTAYRSQSP